MPKLTAESSPKEIRGAGEVVRLLKTRRGAHAVQGGFTVPSDGNAVSLMPTSSKARAFVNQETEFAHGEDES